MAVAKEICDKDLGEIQHVKAKQVGSVLPKNSRLNAKQCPNREKDKAEMRKVPYASAVSSLMYVMVYTRPGVAFVVGVVRRYMINPG